jgi:hypothetical protein
MNRLLSLEAHLTKSPNFQSYRYASTIDKEELNKAVYGPNYKERSKAFDFIKKNSNVF